MSLMKAQDWYQYFVIFLKAIECSSVPTISRMVVDKMRQQNQQGLLLWID